MIVLYLGVLFLIFYSMLSLGYSCLSIVLVSNWKSFVFLFVLSKTQQSLLFRWNRVSWQFNRTLDRQFGLMDLLRKKERITRLLLRRNDHWRLLCFLLQRTRLVSRRWRHRRGYILLFHKITQINKAHNNKNNNEHTQYHYRQRHAVAVNLSPDTVLLTQIARSCDGSDVMSQHTAAVELNLVHLTALPDSVFFTHPFPHFHV